MRIVLTMLLISILQGVSFSQNSSLNVFSAGGGYFNGVTMQQSWTIGEVVTQTATGQAMTLTQGFQQSDQMRDLAGQLTYDNVAHSVLSNTNVLLKVGGLTTQQVITNNAGYYMFQSLQNGSYQLTGQSSMPWGGCNSTDALLIMKHFTGISPLNGIRLKAADANASGNVNSLDALQVARRFVGLQSSFPLGDWVFENHNVLINGFSNLTDNFKGLCTGDVNGSNNLSGLKSESLVNITDKGVIVTKDGEDIIIPVCLKEDVRLAALSLVLNYSEELGSIKSVSCVSENPNLIYNTHKGELRLSWYTLNPLERKAGETLLNIRVQCDLVNFHKNDSFQFTIGQESELSDFSGNVIYDKTLEIPVIIKMEDGIYLAQNIPNPGNEMSSIQFSLPEHGNVQLLFTNLPGQESQVLLDEGFEAGSHTFNLDCNPIPAGVYLYTMKYTTNSQIYSSSRRMVVVH